MTGTGLKDRHREEQSDEAIQSRVGALDCFAALAMTAHVRGLFV